MNHADRSQIVLHEIRGAQVQNIETFDSVQFLFRRMQSHDCLISFWGRVAHCFSCASNRLICDLTTVEYDRKPAVAEYFIKSVRDISALPQFDGAFIAM